MEAIAERHSRAVLVALALALLLRALLGLADAVAIFQGGVRAIPIPEGVALTSPSPLWPLVLAATALAGAAGLPMRTLVGWSLAVIACVACLTSGIADLGSMRPGWPLRDVGFWIFFAANVVVPAAVLAILVALRSWFVDLARRSRSLPRRAPGARR